MRPRLLDAVPVFRYVTADNAPNYRALLEVFVEAKERYLIELRPADVREGLAGSRLHFERPADADPERHLDQHLDQLSGFLSASLPPLDRAVVGPIAEGFERLDHHRAELEARTETLGKLRAFEEIHRAYARAVAKGRAVDLTRAERAYHAARAEARERAATRDEAIARRDALERRAAELEVRARGLEERIRALEGSDAYRAARDLDEAEEASRRARASADAAARRAAEDEGLGAAAETRRAEAAAEVTLRAERLEAARATAGERAREAGLAGGHAAVDALAAKGDADGAAGALAAIRAEREAVLATLRRLARELAAALEAARRAEERARERAEALEAARDALRGAEAALADAEEAWEAAVERWAASLAVLPRQALPPVRPDGAPLAPRVFRAGAEALAHPIRHALAEERAAAAARLAAARSEADGLRAERDGLAAAVHPAPAPPAWRATRPLGRPGAPLFLVCDFGPAAANAEAGLEAALEAAGLLDAWVEPDGTLLDPHTGDAVLRGGAASGASLADVLVPVAAGGVTEARARAALASVGLAAPGESPDGAAWVSPDGRWRLGPLHGAHARAAPAWIGAAARERERARRIAELDARIVALDEATRAHEGEVRRAEARTASLALELTGVPAGDGVEAARGRVSVRAEALAEARDRHAVAERAAAEAQRSAREGGAALDRAAAAAGLAAFARDPDGLAERSRVWAGAAEALVSAARELSRAHASLAREARGAAEAAERAARSRAEAGEAAREASGAVERARALRETSGKERDEVLAALRMAREGTRELARGRAETDRESKEAQESVGAARSAAEQAEAAVGAREDARQEAGLALRALAGAGVLAAAGLEEQGRELGAGGGEPAGAAREALTSAGSGRAETAGPATFTATLELARSVDAAVTAGATAEERERAENKLVARGGELALQLPADVRLLPSKADGVLAYAFTWGGRERPAREVVRELEADIASRTALLGDEERGLLEAFLSGEAHDHLAARLREARGLVDRMNAALSARTTAAGAQVRLGWELDETAQEDAREAVPLFLKAGALLSERNRVALRAFLERRLALARDADGARTLQDRLLDVLDYRAWHRFHVDHRTPGEPWAKLTRKAHAAGSGGKKAVMLHLPLFAAAAAFYGSAQPTAPRAIALDEAFAGIDKPTRGKLMGLLAEFDLDFVMTSFEGDEAPRTPRTAPSRSGLQHPPLLTCRQGISGCAAMTSSGTCVTASPMMPKQRETASSVRSSATKAATSMSATYRWARAAASRMSSMRRRHSLGGTDRLAEDAVAELRLHGFSHDQVDAATEDLLQTPLNPEEVEESDGPLELDEEIHVAVRRGFAAGHGTEDVEGANSEPRKLASLHVESALDLFARHYSDHGAARQARLAARRALPASGHRAGPRLRGPPRGASPLRWSPPV